jgi:demethylmenaquinone methyltransferase/2-methoxy-6-polyprenyl-1,4-benzoquinol methylase
MFEVGKQPRPWLPFVAVDATRLRCADRTLDAVTISFGQGNVRDYPRGFAEMLEWRDLTGGIVALHRAIRRA